MRILINASNLRAGGGLQVADSIVHELKNHPEHTYVAVVSSKLTRACSDAARSGQVEVVEYDLPHSIVQAVTGRDRFLDSLVEEKRIDAVLTVFGPSRWRPRRPHLCGFARPQVVIPESPYWREIKGVQRAKSNATKTMTKRLFAVSADSLWTENSFISSRVKELWPKKRVFTVTNNYNQVFDSPAQWDNSVALPPFDGLTLLTVSAHYPHKNLDIIRPCIEWLAEHQPQLRFRFVLTLHEDKFPLRTALEREHVVLVGPVDIRQVPHLYEQSGVMFLPTLLECFSASYTEAMRMRVPILTTDLGFAHSICAEAACYFEPVSPSDLGRKIARLAADKAYCQQLTEAGTHRLPCFDTFAERAQKLIEITASLAEKKH